jgi:CubicO group peptidase (beta-lactamase class C family)
MASTHFDDDLGLVVRNRVTGYNAREAGGYRREIRRSPHFGGSGLFTTIEDLARWDRSFETHELGGPELTALLLGTRRFEHDKVNDAFGLVWGDYRGHRTLWYEGGDLGFSSYMVRLPDVRLTVIELSNLGTGRAADHAGQVLEALFDEP